jgi:ClpP class serine protease
MPERYKGFVSSGHVNRDNKLVWKVRVKDPNSGQYNGQEILVASVYGDIVLARGLNVNFTIGTVDNAQKQQELRAVDVRLESPGAESETSGQLNVRRVR